MRNTDMWKVSEYNKREIERAGQIIATSRSSPDEIKNALIIIDNWRAAHAFPLNTFAIRLRHFTEKDENAIVVQRLKRLDSITEKLKRYPKMSLYRMQDLGGCRAIVGDIHEVYSLVDKFRNSRIRHILKREYDYIANPKQSGYRGVHLVYEYHSERNSSYNKMLIEVQLRTRLQHLWATAVETMGIFTNNALKASQGDRDLLRFFVLISSLFAIDELSSPVPGTGEDRKIIIEELERLERSNHIFETLSAIRQAINMTEQRPDWKNGYYILILNYEEHKITVRYFKKSQLDYASTVYSDVEKSRGAQKINAVLVSSTSFDSLKRAYPNYFTDVKEFAQTVRSLMDK